VKDSSTDRAADIAQDDYTNRFLAAYPIHCERRTVRPEQRLLHTHDGYEIYYCLHGYGSYVVGDSLFPLHPGTLTLIRPHVIHRPYAKPEQELHRYVLSIDDSYMETIRAACRASAPEFDRLLSAASPGTGGHYLLSTLQQAEAERLLAELEQALRRKEIGDELQALISTTQLLLLLLALRDPSGSRTVARSEDEQIIAGVLAYLVAHYQQPLQIDDLLPLFPLSRSRLLFLFKEVTGTTIKQFLTEYRLNLAKRLLLTTTLAVTEVAMNCGFGDMSHFHHVFKQETGRTPLQYRKSDGLKRQPNPCHTVSLHK